tara:strand:+ start:551 stop:667 length:117 start_codon:yes stop_codon:yes gene_type:complete
MDPKEIPASIFDAIHSLIFPKRIDKGIHKGTDKAEGNK